MDTGKKMIRPATAAGSMAGPAPRPALGAWARLWRAAGLCALGLGALGPGTPGLGAFGLGALPAAASVSFDAALEWNGPYFRVFNSPTTDQLTDDPVHDIAFVTPTDVAVREHPTHQRDVVYVLDSGHGRVQAFEANALIGRAVQPSTSTPFTWQGAGASAALQWDGSTIHLPEWAASATHFVVPFSESVVVDGHAWTRVADLGTFTATDHVYHMAYDDASNAPEVLFPAGSLSATSTFTVRYTVSDPHTGASAAFGLGDVDYGIGKGATPVLTRIDAASGGPTAWHNMRAIALSPGEQDSTSDDIFLLDAGGTSGKLFSFTVNESGGVTFRETYTDHLSTPWGLAVARAGASQAAAVDLSDDSGPFDRASAAVVDANQVTGHTYQITVAAGLVTITDTATGKVLVKDATFAALADPFLGIPGLSLPKNPAVGSSASIYTTAAIPGRYLLVADTTANQVKVISAADGPSWAGGWLRGDLHTCLPQPTGAD
jgi:hypothetical protein